VCVSAVDFGIGVPKSIVSNLVSEEAPSPNSETLSRRVIHFAENRLSCVSNQIPSSLIRAVVYVTLPSVVWVYSISLFFLSLRRISGGVLLFPYLTRLSDFIFLVYVSMYIWV
jgi:hypothetical protein